jgi:hypothetical protein
MDTERHQEKTMWREEDMQIKSHKEKETSREKEKR